MVCEEKKTEQRSGEALYLLGQMPAWKLRPVSGCKKNLMALDALDGRLS